MVGSEVCSGDHSGAVFIHNKRNRRHKVCDRQKIACHIIYSMMGTVHVSFVVIKVNSFWHYDHSGVDLMVCICLYMILSWLND